MTEEALFDLAAHAPPAERAAILNRECAGNPALRARVEALLAADADGTRAPFPEPPTRDVSTDEAGAVLAGRYKLVERIGEGGMGTVWLANQTEPVRRKVAVKLVKAGMDSRGVLARFEAERQALAMMDHPNIAKVLDAGLTPDLRPFFVMELVKGLPITEYCDAKKLTPRERLELFVPVTQAIQHAHQKGIIHRDIKPSNVLVALYDDRAVPKVIDFGVAKATGGTLTEATINTGFGGVVGTPQYMSPEQATLNNLDIDTRSDVYSLGVLLYELLAGAPPFKRDELEKRGLLEILRVVREEEPPRPSAKLSTADALPTLSANRGTEPKKLTGLLRNELDWIVMKALEKDRARRYETANGFAADINRYLAGEAVLAHPPSLGYRWRKFSSKNRGAIMSTYLLLAGVLGFTGTLWNQVDRARAAEKVAVAEQAKAELAAKAEAEQRAVAEAKREEAERDRKEAEARRAEAQGARAGEATANTELQKKVVRLDLATASRFADAGNPDAALLWQDRAWREDPEKDANEASHRLRLGLAHQDKPTLIGLAVHNEPLADARIDDSGRRVLTRTSGGKAVLWDIQAGVPITRLEHSDKVTAIALHVEGGLALTGGTDGTVRVWDAANGTLLRSITHGSPVTGLDWRPGGTVFASAGGKDGVRVWDAANGEPSGTTFDAAGAYGVSFAGGRWVTATMTGFAQVWDADTGKPVGEPHPHRPQDNSEMTWSLRSAPALSPDGKTLLTTIRDEKTGNILLHGWNADTGKKLWTTNWGGNSYRFDPDGKRIIAAGFTASYVIDPATGAMSKPATTPRVCNAAAFLDGSRLLTASTGGLVQVWDAAGPTPSHTGETIQAAEWVRAITVLPGGRRVLLTSGDGTARLYDFTRPEGTLVSQSGSADHVLRRRGSRFVCYSPDSRIECEYGGNGPTRLGPPGAAEHPVVLDVQADAVRFTPDGKAVVTKAGQEMRMWDTDTGKPLGPVIAVAADAKMYLGGQRVAVSSEADTTVKLFDLGTGKKVFSKTYPGSDSTNNVCAISRDGRLATGTFRFAGPIEVWDPETGKLLVQIRAHRGFTYGVSFTADGSGLIVASSDTTARLWDSRKGTALGPPLRHDAVCCAASVSKAGTMAATRDASGRIQLWNPYTGERFGRWMIWPEATAPTRDVWFSADGQTLYYDGEDRVRSVPIRPLTTLPAAIGLLNELTTGQRIDDATEGIEYLPAYAFMKDPASYLNAFRAAKGLAPAVEPTPAMRAAPPNRTLTAREALQAVGHTVTVEMTVVSTGVSQTANWLYLNSEARYSNVNNLQVAVRKATPEQRKTLGLDVPDGDLVGRRLRVTGEVSEFRGRTQIIVDRADQIEFVKP